MKGLSELLLKRIAFRNKATQILTVLAIITVGFGCKMYFDTTSDKYTATKKPESFERGQNIVFNVCGSCHYDHKVNKFIGKHLNDLPKIAGELYSANLTHSKTDGIPPHYSDAELFYLLKTGIAKNGYFMPYMMRPMMADEDINDVIVYLRSNDPPLDAADTTVGKTHINFIGNAGIRHLSSPQPYNKGAVRPNESDSGSYGRYLVAIIGCYHCHSSKIGSLNYMDAEKTKGFMTGGIKLKSPEGKKLYGSNLTPDKETGIGNYSAEDFRKAVTEGITPTGKKLSPPMPRFKELSDKQSHAIFAYLKSLPPVKHKIKGQESRHQSPAAISQNPVDSLSERQTDRQVSAGSRYLGDAYRMLVRKIFIDDDSKNK